MNGSATSVPTSSTRKNAKIPCPLSSCAYKHRKVSNILKHFKKTHPTKLILKCLRCLAFVARSVKKMARHIRNNCSGNDIHYDCTCFSSRKLEEGKFIKCKFSLQFHCFHCSFTIDKVDEFNHHIERNCLTELPDNGMQEIVVKQEPTLYVKKSKPDSQSNDQKLERTMSQSSDHKQDFSADVSFRQIHPCPQCGKCFTRRSSIKAHMVVHTDERLFNCTLCPYKARRQGDLSLHINKLHNGERPYTCSHCSKQFGFKTNLTRHLRIHYGEKPFHCDLCGGDFRYKDSYEKHYQKCKPS